MVVFCISHIWRLERAIATILDTNLIIIIFTGEHSPHIAPPPAGTHIHTHKNSANHSEKLLLSDVDWTSRFLHTSFILWKEWILFFWTVGHVVSASANRVDIGLCETSWVRLICVQTKKPGPTKHELMFHGPHSCQDSQFVCWTSKIFTLRMLILIVIVFGMFIPVQRRFRVGHRRRSSDIRRRMGWIVRYVFESGLLRH